MAALQRAVGQEGSASEMLAEADPGLKIDGAINYEQFYYLLVGENAGALQEFLRDFVGADLVAELREQTKAAKELGERYQQAFGPEGEYAEHPSACRTPGSRTRSWRRTASSCS